MAGLQKIGLGMVRQLFGGNKHVYAPSEIHTLSLEQVSFDCLGEVLVCLPLARRARESFGPKM